MSSGGSEITTNRSVERTQPSSNPRTTPARTVTDSTSHVLPSYRSGPATYWADSCAYLDPLREFYLLSSLFRARIRASAPPTCNSDLPSPLFCGRTRCLNPVHPQTHEQAEEHSPKWTKARRRRCPRSRPMCVQPTQRRL